MRKSFITKLTGRGHTSRRNVSILAAAMLSLAPLQGVIAAQFDGPAPHDGNAGQRLRIVYTDSSSGLLSTDPAQEEVALVSSGRYLVQPLSIAAGQGDNVVYLSDTGSASIIAVDLRTGEQFLISSGGILGVPFGIALEHNGNILAANARTLIRINIHTGEQSVVSSGGLLNAPLWVAVTTRGDILVVDGSRKIISVEPKTGKQTLISQAGLLNAPQDLAVHDDDIYVTDVATSDGNFGVGRVVHVDLPTGTQRIVSEGGCLVGPVGIAIDDDGQLIVGDPYTINENSPDLFDGGIIRINPATGDQKLLARGQGNFVNPRGVAIVKVH